MRHKMLLAKLKHKLHINLKLIRIEAITYNVIMRRVLVTIVEVEKEYILHNLKVCLWPNLFSMQIGACATLYYLWSIRLYHIPPRYLIKVMIFRQKLLNIKLSFNSSAPFFLKQLSF
jgi:hypothetical protein